MTSASFQNQQDRQTSTIETKPRILIVDDNVELLEELKDMLGMSGYEVSTLNEGHKALDAALKNKPDLILLDLKMSPKSGFQIADEITNSVPLKDVPIVAMTGFFTEKQHLLMMKLCGIKTSILKPFWPVNLISKIEFALGNRMKENDAEGT